MKKITIFVLATEREDALSRLRELGLLHVEISEKKESDDRTEWEHRISGLEKVINFLSSEKSNLKTAPQRLEKLNPIALYREADIAISKLIEREKSMETLIRNRDALLPWGNFSWELLETIKKDGLNVYLCSAPDEYYHELSKKYHCELVNLSAKVASFAILSREAIDTSELPIALLPEGITLKSSLISIDKLNDEIKELKNEIDSIKPLLHKFLALRDLTEARLEFLSNRDGMPVQGGIAYIQGYIPEDEMNRLKTSSKENGWGIVACDPSPEDRVPTLMKVPKPFLISKPVFDFIGISPGYHEWDVSICFIIYFTIFFGMIVGDAGYGLLFLASAIFAKFRYGTNEKLTLPINLLSVLSLSTIIWGILTCSYFGIAQNKLPSLLADTLCFKPFTDSDPNKNKHIQLFCFILAASHLSFARLWKAWILKSFKSLGQIGWALLIWANFITVVKLLIYPGQFPSITFVLYGVSLVLLLLFYINWRDLGDIFNFPFGLIGSFTDVLSYIRLFAVGISSYYVANSFNDMGKMIFGISPCLFVFGILVIFFGHTLNIMLAILGVLVHGIRLNTLEFSNHMELQWSGFSYKPFKIPETELDIAEVRKDFEEATKKLYTL